MCEISYIYDILYFFFMLGNGRSLLTDIFHDNETMNEPRAYSKENVRQNELVLGKTDK